MLIDEGIFVIMQYLSTIQNQLYEACWVTSTTTSPYSNVDWCFNGFIKGLPPFNCHTIIMVIVYWLIKYTHFVALKHLFTRVNVAKPVVVNVVRLHDIPTSIVSNRDEVFINTFWRALFHLQGTKLYMSSSYHPQSNGQIMVVNLTLE